MLESSKMCPQKLREVIVWSESGNDDLVLRLCVRAFLPQLHKLPAPPSLLGTVSAISAATFQKKVGKEPAQLDSAGTGERNGAARCEA